MITDELIGSLERKLEEIFQTHGHEILKISITEGLTPNPDWDVEAVRTRINNNIDNLVVGDFMQKNGEINIIVNLKEKVLWCCVRPNETFSKVNWCMHKYYKDNNIKFNKKMPMGLLHKLIKII